jgi:hypothetical protein
MSWKKPNIIFIYLLFLLCLSLIWLVFNCEPAPRRIKETPIYSLDLSGRVFMVECHDTDSGLVYAVGVQTIGRRIKKKFLPVSLCVERIPEDDEISTPRYIEGLEDCPRKLYLPSETYFEYY